MADVVKNITANINVVPKGIDDAKAKLQELLKSSNISEAVKIDIQKALSKIDEIGPRIQGQLSSGAVNVDRLGIGKIEDAVFAIAKKINKEMGVAFDTTKVDELTEKIKDVESKINSSATSTQVLEKNLGKVQAEINKKGEGAGLGPGFKGPENVAAVKNRIAELEEKQSKGKKDSEASGKRGAELKRLIAYLKEIDPLLKKQDDYNAKILEKNKEQVKLGEEAAKLQADKSVAIKEAVAKTPEAKNVMGAAEDVGASKKELLELQNKQIQASIDEAEATNELDGAHKKHKKTLLEKIFALLTFQKIMGFVNRVIKDSIKTIKDLDKAMTDVAITTNLSREEAWKYLGAMQSLAKETGLATSQVSGVVVQFLRQGRSMADAFKLAEVAAKSAKVAGISANEAVNYLTSAVNGFGLAANQAETIADKFAAIAAKSATSFEELALAMSKVSPTAKAAGVGVDFMMGVIAKGIETTREAPENIGTAFKTIFARMREVTDIGKAMEDGMSLNRVEKALESVDVSLRDTSGQFRNLEDVLTEVGRKWNTLTSIEQAYLATALAGSRQQPRLLAIFNNFERTEELIAISASAAGELEDQHLEYMEGLEAAMTRMKNAWEQVVTAFMSSEVVIQIVNFLTGSFEIIAAVIGGVATPIQATTFAIIGLTVALGAYTIAKHKANLAEQNAIALGQTTSLLLLKNTLLNWAYAGSLSAVDIAQKSQQMNLFAVIATTIGAAIARAKLALATSLGLAVESNYNMALDLQKMSLFELLILKMQSISVSKMLAAIGMLLFNTGMKEIVIDKAKTGAKKSVIISQLLENAGKAGSIALSILMFIWETALLALKFALVAVTLLLSAALYILSGAWIVALAPLLPFIALGAAVVAVIWLLIEGFLLLIRDVDYYAKGIAKANKEMKELESRENNIKKLTKRFDELNQKVEKTAEDLDEMKSIAEELDEVKVGDKTFSLMTEDAFGNQMVDMKAFNDYLAASAKERQKLINDEYKLLNTSIRDEGKRALDNPTIANSARRMGYRMVESTIEGIEDADLREQVEKSVKTSLARVDMKAFVNTRGVLDTKALEAFTKKQTELFTEYYTNLDLLSKKEADAIKGGMSKTEAKAETIKAQIENYKNAIAEINAMTNLSEAQKTELKAAVDLTMSGEKALLILIEERNLDVNMIANMQLKGLNLNEIAEFFNDEYDLIVRVSYEQVGADPEVDLDAKKAELERLKSTNFFGVNQSKIDALEEEIEAEEALRNSAQETIEARKDRIQTLLGDIFDGTGDLSADMQAYRDYLKNELNLTDEEIQQEMAEMYNSLGVKSASAIAEAISNTKSDREALYNLPAEIAKGNFESMIDLAGEYGADAVSAFISGDPDKIEGFFAEQKEQTLANIDESIEAIEGMRDEEGKLTEAQEAELLQLQTMRSYYEDMSAADQERAYWLGKSKNLLEEMNELLKIANDLMTLGLSEEHPFITMLNSLADAKYESAITSLQESLDNELEALLEFGTFDENGVFTFSEGVDMVAGQAALDGYLETLGDFTNTLVAEYNRQAEIIKKRYQEEIDSIKEAHSERWKEIEYLDKVAELEEKIIDARRQLMAFSLDSSMGGQMIDSLEALQKLQQERQKMIEQKMMEEAQKQLEAERDEALLTLGREQVAKMEDLIDSLDDLNGTMRTRNETPPEAVGGSSATGGGSGIRSIVPDTIGVF